jgi:hypothetical protein
MKYIDRAKKYENPFFDKIEWEWLLTEWEIKGLMEIWLQRVYERVMNNMPQITEEDIIKNIQERLKD